MMRSSVSLVTMVVMVVMVMLTLMRGAEAARLTPCEAAIYYCCDPFSNSLLPLRCFELNKCPGLYWAGPRICSKLFIDKVTRKRLAPEKKTEISTRTNEIQDQKRKTKKSFKKKSKNESPSQLRTLSSKYSSVSGPLPFNQPTRTSSSLVSTRDSKSKKESKLKLNSLSSKHSLVSGPLPSNRSIRTSLSSLVSLRPESDPVVKCSRAILRCCDLKSTQLPLRCFEQNGCPGIYWQRRQKAGACSFELVSRAKTQLGVTEE